MQEQKGIITSVILLRAIAALGVCFVHLKMLTDFKTSAFLNYIFVNGQQGVTIFFVISGFILPYSLYKKQYQIKDFFNFILKRSVRVDPPYWCCILLLFILTPLPFSDFNFRGILFHITYLVPFIKSAHWYSDIFWTLSIEFQFYILLGLLYPVFMKLPYYVSILIIVLVSALCLKFTYRGIIIANLYQFAFGYIAFMAYTNMIDRKKFIIVFVLFTAYIVYAKSIISGIIPGCTVVFISYYKNSNKVPIFNFLGNISYSLYLVHIPVSTMVVRILSPYLKSMELLFIICLLTSILFSYIFFLLIEKPALNLSKRLNFRRLLLR